MCSNIDFLKNLLTSDLGGHCFIFGLYFMILSPEEIDILSLAKPQSFAVSAYFRFNPSFNNSILKSLLYTRPSQYGNLFEVGELRG